MCSNPYKIAWNNNTFWAGANVFSPKESSIGFLSEIVNYSAQLSTKVSILDLCCGIGAIGISSILAQPKSLNSFYGFDNDTESVLFCRMNIDLHKIDGEAYLWQAGEKLPKIEKSIAVCNPPFLPKKGIIDTPKESLIFSNNEGLEVLLKCFESVKGTGHVLILKSLKSQVPKILNKVGGDFSLLRQTNQKIETNYTIAFTTWTQK